MERGKIFLVVVVLAVALCLVHSEESREIIPNLSGQDVCTGEVTVGVPKYFNNCTVWTCYHNNRQSLLLIKTGCGLVAPKPGCNVVSNRNASHPECCPKLQC